jgi:glycosyltransferase involved in cell wall biosynthesis
MAELALELAIVEGMQVGLPMIVTDIGGNAEAVIDGDTGLVVAPHNPDALAAAILRLASDGELRRRYGEAVPPRRGAFQPPEMRGGLRGIVWRSA